MKKIPYVLFICTLIFAPLAFGTVEQWSLLTVEVLIALAAIVYSIQLIKTSGSFLHVPGFIPLLLLMGWMIFQLVPLPVILVKVLSPATYQVYKPIYDMLEGNRWMPLTVYQKGTVQECLRIVSYILFYILTIQLLSGAERLKQTVKICSWLAIGVAVLAILQKFSSPNKIYWFRSAPLDSSPIGPWINHSQYCGYIEAIGPVVLALLLYYWPVFSTNESLRKRIIAFFTMIGENFHIFLGIGVLIMASSVFISMSRGGIIALTFSLLFFFIILRKREPKYSNLFFAGVAVCLMVSIAFLVGWGSIFERFGHTFTDGRIKFDRIPIWQNSSEIFRDYWFAGSGFGTFINIFPNYKTIPDDFIYDHAHNDYIELLTDGGIVGFVLVAWFVIAVVREGWKMIGRRRDRYSILISIGALSGILAMLIHSVSDFNMHNGADGVYFFFLCGLLVSAGNTRFQYHTQSTLLPRMSWPSKNLLLGATLLFLGAVVVGQGGAMVARWKYEGVKDIYLSRQLADTYLQQISTTVKQAARLDPFEGMYPFLLGDVARFQGHLDKALEYYVQAGKKEPLEGAFLQRIGLMLPKEHQQFAEVLMEKGAKSTFKKDDMMLSRAEWLLETGQREKAIEILRDGLIQKPRLVNIVSPFLQGATFTREEITAVLPLTVDAWIQYGSLLEKMGNLEEAEYFLNHALDFLEGEKNIQTRWFMHLYTFYTKQKEYEKALEVLRLGITKIPDYAPFHIRLGDYYAKEGILYRAKEEYQQALLLEPKNESVRKAIERMSGKR
jgi:tetratricopeptide (TPR) repeat protein/O-antigen ligase